MDRSRSGDRIDHHDSEDGFGLFRFIRGRFPDLSLFQLERKGTSIHSMLNKGQFSQTSVGGERFLKESGSEGGSDREGHLRGEQA